MGREVDWVDPVDWVDKTIEENGKTMCMASVFMAVIGVAARLGTYAMEALAEASFFFKGVGLGFELAVEEAGSNGNEQKHGVCCDFGIGDRF